MKPVAVIIAALLVSASAAVSAPPLAPPSPTAPVAQVFQAFTKPSLDVTLSFVRPGRITDLMVKEGDKVKAGDLVAKQDETDEQAALALAAEQAKDVTRISAQEQVRDLKEKTYLRKKESGVASAAELDEALLDWNVGKANVALSKFEHEQDIRKVAQAQAAVDKTRITIPKSIATATVEELFLKVGENADVQNLKVMRIVNIDPLWIEVSVPFAIGLHLKQNDAATVTMTGNAVRNGKIVHVGDTGNAASGTMLIRVEVENRAKTPAGDRVNVTFPGVANVAAIQPEQR